MTLVLLVLGLRQVRLTIGLCVLFRLRYMVQVVLTVLLVLFVVSRMQILPNGECSAIPLPVIEPTL